MKLRGKDGLEMMDIKSIEQEGNRILIKGKMMGTMAATIVITPDDVWDAYRLVPMATLLRLPLILLKGWRIRRNSQRGQ